MDKKSLVEWCSVWKTQGITNVYLDEESWDDLVKTKDDRIHYSEEHKVYVIDGVEVRQIITGK